jgi:hypothetical protein
MTLFTDASIRQVLDAALDTLPLDPKLAPDLGMIEREAAVAAVVALDPQDATEAMFASRAVIAHFAAMVCFRCDAQPELSDSKMMRFLGKALALSNLATEMHDALKQRQVQARRADPAGPAALPLPAAPAAAPVIAPAEPAPQPPEKQTHPRLVSDGPTPGTTIH